MNNITFKFNETAQSGEIFINDKKVNGVTKSKFTAINGNIRNKEGKLKVELVMSMVGKTEDNSPVLYTETFTYPDEVGTIINISNFWDNQPALNSNSDEIENIELKS